MHVRRPLNPAVTFVFDVMREPGPVTFGCVNTYVRASQLPTDEFWVRCITDAHGDVDFVARQIDDLIVNSELELQSTVLLEHLVQHFGCRH